MTEFNLLKCPQFIDNAITPPAKEIGITLGNIFYTIFSPINYNVEKLRMKHAENLKQYEIDIKNELSKIPEEKLVEPKLSIVGPALEASKYYIEEEELRKMFAKIIASSLNSDTTSKTHVSFVEIIKQLSPLDASNIRIIHSNKILPIAQYRITKTNNTTVLLPEYIFLSNPLNKDTITQSASIINLVRLGLVTVDFETNLIDKSKYLTFEQNDEYIKYCEWANSNDTVKSINIEKGITELTNFGANFSDICI